MVEPLQVSPVLQPLPDVLTQPLEQVGRDTKTGQRRTSVRSPQQQKSEDLFYAEH